jgi:predicted nucleotidyltransferase component of viral defense system
MLDKFFLEDYVKRSGIPNIPRRILTEYLQSEILAVVYNSKFGRHISFMGGTCLRFVYKMERFSEDLDFDLINDGLDYIELAKFIKKKLRELGFSVETFTKKRMNVITVEVRFSQVMKEMGLSVMDDQKLKIKFEIDPNPLKKIKYESIFISSYGKNFNVISNTPETLFAQKVLAINFRPYQKGRDFYDLVWFLSQKNLEPNYAIFKEKGIAVENRRELIDFLEKQAEKSDLKQAAKDVEKFLFYPEQAKWILNLPQYLKSFEGRIVGK